MTPKTLAALCCSVFLIFFSSLSFAAQETHPYCWIDRAEYLFNNVQTKDNSILAADEISFGDFIPRDKRIGGNIAFPDVLLKGKADGLIDRIFVIHGKVR